MATLGYKANKMFKLDRNQSEIRYWVAPALWNSGIATDAVEAILRANPQACDIYAGSLSRQPEFCPHSDHVGFRFIQMRETFCVARNAVPPT
jgi:hypothetical protein